MPKVHSIQATITTRERCYNQHSQSRRIVRTNAIWQNGRKSSTTNHIRNGNGYRKGASHGPFLFLAPKPPRTMSGRRREARPITYIPETDAGMASRIAGNFLQRDIHALWKMARIRPPPCFLTEQNKNTTTMIAAFGREGEISLKIQRKEIISIIYLLLLPGRYFSAS